MSQPVFDGYIADAEGEVGWLDEAKLDDEDYGYAKFYARLSTLIMGRNTYDQIVGFDVDWPYPDRRTVVITHRPIGEPPEGASIEVYDGNLVGLIKGLRSGLEDDIWLVGGGELVAQFLRYHLIDEYDHHDLADHAG